MKQVTKSEFYEQLYAACKNGVDIMPRIVGNTYPYPSEWRDQRVHGASLFGVTKGEPKQYFLCEVSK